MKTILITFTIHLNPLPTKKIMPCCTVFWFSKGCSGIQVEEIYSLDEASLEDLRYYSLIFIIFLYI